MQHYSEMFTHDFKVTFDEKAENLTVAYLDKDGICPHPIEIKFETLKDAGADGAAKFLGERILLLVPRARRELYGLKD